MARLTKTAAVGILTTCGLDWQSPPDFHALDAGKVEAVIACADAVRYRRPANANGSRARMFYQYVTRTAGSWATPRPVAGVAAYGAGMSRRAPPAVSTWA